MEETIHHVRIAEAPFVTRYFAKFDESFFQYCDKELAKINTFFCEKLAEATRRFAALKSELNEYMGRTGPGDLEAMLRRRKRGTFIIRDKETAMARKQTRKLHDLKLAFSEFYLSLILLQNYQNLNYTGFRKILKKHDKLMQTDRGLKLREESVDLAIFYTNKEIDKLISETETLFTVELESGDRQKAMKRLRVPPLGEVTLPWTTFKVGLFLGAFIVLVIAVILSAAFHKGGDDWRIAFRLYRPTLLIILFMFLMGINVYGWRSSGVNHVLIFELDPRNHLSEQHLMEMAGIFGVLWTLSILCFLYSSALSIPPYANPLALLCIMVAFLLNPTRTFRHDARFWLIRRFFRIITAPFFYVGFADFWLADQLNSLVPVLTDLQYFMCFYIDHVEWNEHNDHRKCMDRSYGIRPIVACLPAWFRFAQCLRRYRDSKEAFPHLANAGKYSTTFFVVIFSTLNSYYRETYHNTVHNPFFYMWIATSIISSCYAYIWDIKMDWGLFDQNAGENTCLREEIVYSSSGYYYFGIVEDFILRFGWAFSVSLIESGYVHADLMVTILAPLEVFRRFVWNYFRLENEHLNNCGKFRAVRDISVAPINAGDQSELLKMMDEPDGVNNRKKENTKKRLFKLRKMNDTRVLY
uniref:Xenotropic and polytropic retrovirus receptor 1 n=1 Tax=Strigamia maritima TaxID=126957 RepID=T1JMQ6_STRMM